MTGCAPPEGLLWSAKFLSVLGKFYVQPLTPVGGRTYSGGEWEKVG